jgi:hypothetical protein
VKRGKRGDQRADDYRHTEGGRCLILAGYKKALTRQVKPRFHHLAASAKGLLQFRNTVAWARVLPWR